MKKIILFLLLSYSVLSTSQEVNFLQIGVDPSLLIDGAYDYDKSPVLNVFFRAGTKFESNIAAGMSIEYADLNPFYLSYGVFASKVFNLSNIISISTGPEFVVLQRGRFTNNNKYNPFYTFGINGDINFALNDYLSLGLRSFLIHRKDLHKEYNEHKFFNFNGYFTLTYNLKRR